MTRRKGERTAAMEERDFPFIVSHVLPDGGLGKRLFEMYDWHKARGLEYRRGRRQRLHDREYCRLCFPDVETAQAFVDAFGGQIVGPVTSRARRN
ncbi:MAG: hypothetical protein AB7O60_03680 [Variibacter sp.]